VSNLSSKKTINKSNSTRNKIIHLQKRSSKHNERSKDNKKNNSNKSFDFGGRKLRIILIVLISVFVVIALAMFLVYLFYGNNILSVNELNATIGVDDYIGFNLDKDKLHFGTSMPGGTSMRELNLTSPANGFIYVTIDPEFKNWAYVSMQNAHIDAGVPTLFNVKLFVPESAKVGNYTFGMKVFILKRKADFIAKYFLQSTPISSDLKSFEGEGSAKVSLEIVNSSQPK
jgi:hypothetical protein